MLLWILIFTFLGSIVSLLIAASLLFKKGFIEKRIAWLVAFAAGAMLAAAFFDLLPEAMGMIGKFGGFGDFGGIFNFTFLGIISFFFLERSLLWYHHHACLPDEAASFAEVATKAESAKAGPEKKCPRIVPTASLIIIGDGLHNFLDGVTIAAAFLVNFQLGMVTSLAVFFHEIPQEIGDFGVLISSGMRKKDAIIFNGLSSLVAFAGAILAFYFLKSFAGLIPYFMAFAAGNFIYIAASDLIPELHQHFEKETAISQTLSFVVGVVLILLTIRIFA